LKRDTEQSGEEKKNRSKGTNTAIKKKLRRSPEFCCRIHHSICTQKSRKNTGTEGEGAAKGTAGDEGLWWGVGRRAEG